MAASARTEHFREVVRLSDIADVAVVTGHEFIECHIVGPTVVVPHTDVAMVECAFGGGPDARSLTWPMERDRIYVGAITLEHVGFYRCRFEGVGIAGPPDFLDHWVENITQG